MTSIESTRNALKAMVFLLVLAGALPAQAQEDTECRLLCSPELNFEPTITFENFADPPTVVALREGIPTDTFEVESESAFEMIFALDVPTTVPRVGLTLEAIWTPFAETDSNPFTGRTAEQVGEKITDNPLELEAELNFTLLRPEDTGEWAEVHVDVVDKFSPAEDPDADALYTQKLNLELDAGFAVFNWLPKGNWLRNVELEGSLDYVATGLPDAGDRLGEELFLESASPWGFSVLLVIPIIPL